MVKFRRSPPPLSSGLGRGPLKAETRVRFSLGALPIALVITLRWKKLPRAKSANSSFDPFKRKEFDRRNQEIYALHIWVKTARGGGTKVWLI